jgi:tRNA 5-methylaminomethyl-2-thiouridine biosynthesis bifunctional protein
MQPKVMSHPPAPNFHATHWKHRKAGQSSWHAIDTAFEQGHSLQATLQAWRSDPEAPDKLFYTAFASESPRHLAPELAQHCFGLLPGVHRICLEQGQVLLTLCIGPAPQIGREINVAADSIEVDVLERWGVKNLARWCKHGSQVRWAQCHTNTLSELKSAGFELNVETNTSQFWPHWTPLNQNHATSASSAIVVGAGLAGSAIAYSLAIRGWSVEVIDQGHAIGAGASGLPAGIFATHVSPDNNVLSRITRDGVRATVQRAVLLLQPGQDWQLSNLLEHRYAGKRELPKGAHWPAAGLEWSAVATDDQKMAGGLTQQSRALWHPISGWIKPQALVNAQLRHPQIRIQTSACANTLVRKDNQWAVLDPLGKCIAQSQHVILANAQNCQALLNSVALGTPEGTVSRPFLPITPLRGQVTYGFMDQMPSSLQDKLPAFPVNGHGSYIGRLPFKQGTDSRPYWIIGSSFQRHDLSIECRAEDQLSNMTQWAELMPALQEDIASGLVLDQTQAWAGIRCALPDRLPAVGAFKHPSYEGLHVCTGMGARGLSWAVLCGELLASKILKEPLPMAASLAKLMAADRFG